MEVIAGYATPILMSSTIVLLVFLYLEAKKLAKPKSDFPKALFILAAILLLILLIPAIFYLCLLSFYVIVFVFAFMLFLDLGLLCIIVGLHRFNNGITAPSVFGLPGWKWWLIAGLICSFVLAPLSIWLINLSGYKSPPPSLCYMLIPSSKYALNDNKLGPLVSKFEKKGILTADAARKILDR